MPGPGDPLNVIQRGELNLRLARGLEVRQRSGQGLLLADQVVPVVQLEDLTKQSLAVEPGERRAYMSSGGLIAGVAAQFGAAAILNPVGSGALLVVRGFHAFSSVTQLVSWGITDSLNLPATVAAPWWSDPRNTGIPLATCRTGTPAANIVLTDLLRTNVGATTLQSIAVWPSDFALVLVEGQGFAGQSNLANTAVGFSILWDEIPLR
jgi:hypothetical protein